MMRTGWLIRLYPRAWRERYGDEFEQLVNDVSSHSPHWRAIVDVGRGALDAHLRETFRMRRIWADPVLRRGIFDGLIIAGLIAVDVVLTNVVFPQGPDESDSDPEYLLRYLAELSILAMLLVAIGARARRRQDNAMAGIRAGAAAGVVIAGLTTIIFLVVNNIFLNIVSQQHDKRLAFAASGWSSIRAYLTVQQLGGAVFLIPALGLVGAVLGLVGAAVFRPRGPLARRVAAPEA